MFTAFPRTLTQKTMRVLPRPVKYDDAAICPHSATAPNETME